MSENPARSTGPHLLAWLIDRIRFYGQVDEQDVTPHTPLTELGLDSVYVLTLCGDLEDTFGLVVDPPYLAGFGTLDDLATDLATRLETP
ncbi:acyl carrier protein [Microbacterium caowuchunii]|uniref:Acyl carrier protein n=1 Tax=Microbacterium caowuchunii TaxID=2614638 RepID=A0A5N0THY3_9MICO|nr:acyl carrier protein [Microbacterium caowuchunii]KAA9132919.1 acyl carrier protein [Microbacterium caowuchunii]